MLRWTGAHGKAHAYRAILKGISFETKLMAGGPEKGLERPIEHIIVLGGGSRGLLWCQIVANIVQRPVSV